MLLREIVRARKDVTDWGKWEDGVNIKRPAFHLSKSRDRAYRLSSYRCRIVRFGALGADFRLLIAYRLDKEQYRAILAVEAARDMNVLAQYEFHGTHPGWHLLASCDSDESRPGTMRFPGQRRIPRSRAIHRQVRFDIKSDEQALEKAAKLFRLHKREGALV